MMKTIGVLLLAASTAAGGIGKPHAGGKHFLRPHLVRTGAAPAGGPIAPGVGACTFGHPGCDGGAGCPGAGGGMEAGGQPGRRFPNVRSQIFFVDPPGLNVSWQTGSGPERTYLPPQLVVPARYNFMQGYIYRLKLTNIPGRAGLALYPTIEVAPSTPATDAYLTHNPIPLQFTEEDFDQVIGGGNFVTKVIYLPDPRFQELAIAGVETLVSTRLEPGVDPILEADRRGTILMIVRLGAIDLEMPTSTGGVVVPGTTVMPGSTVLPPGATMAPGSFVLPPGSLPPGVIPGAPGVPPTVTAPAPLPSGPVENAPVSPVAPSDAVAPPPADEGATPPVPEPAPAPGEMPVPGAAPAPGTAPAPDATGLDLPAPGAPQEDVVPVPVPNP